MSSQQQSTSEQQSSTPGQPPSPDRRRYKRILEIILKIGVAIAGSSLVLYIINAIASGIIGTIASDLSGRFFTWLSSAINVNMLPWIVSTIAISGLIIIIVIYILMRHRYLQVRDQLQNTQNELSQARAQAQLDIQSRNEMLFQRDQALSEVQQCRKVSEVDKFIIDNFKNIFPTEGD